MAHKYPEDAEETAGMSLRSGRVIGSEDPQAGFFPSDDVLQSVPEMLEQIRQNISQRSATKDDGTTPSRERKRDFRTGEYHLPPPPGLSASTPLSDEMQLWQKYQQLGVSMGLTGSTLASFVGDQVQRERDQIHLRESQARAEERQARNEERHRREQTEMLVRFEEQRQQDQARLVEILAQQATRQTDHASSPHTRDDYKLVMGKWDESQDIDFFLLHFERTATAHKWAKDKWAVRLPDLLTGRAQTAYLRLTPQEASSYDAIKHAILEEYRKTPDHYRRKFREIRKDTDESFHQFAKRQKLMFDRWIQTVEVPRTYEGIYELILLEQMMDTLQGELASHVRERKPKTAAEAADIAFQRVEARRETRLDAEKRQGMAKNPKAGTAHVKAIQSNGTQASNRSEGKGNKSNKDMSKIICHRCKKPGHFMRECPLPAAAKAIHSHRRRKLNPLWKELQPLCDDCEKIPFRRDLQVRVNGRICSAMRDTGADDICVKPELVKDEDYLESSERVSLAVLGVSGEYQRALIHLDSPFVKGRVQCIVIPELGPDVFIGENATLEDGKEEQLPVYPRKHLLALTRQQAKKAASFQTTPVDQVGGLNINLEQLKDLQQADPTLTRARETAKENKRVGKDQRVSFTTYKGVLKRVFTDHQGKHSQVCVPKELRNTVLKLGHDTPMSGHLGAKKTQERVWSTFYWPGMCTDIRRYCQSCDRCQKITPRGKVSKVPLGKMPLSHTPFEKVAVDIVGPIKPASDDGNRYILVVVDYATRYPEATPLKSIESERVAEALWHMWTRVGIPKEVLTDRGTQFTSACMQEVYKLLAIHGQLTTPYHAQCNGLVERFNGTLKSMLRKMAGEQPRMWDRFIPALLFAYREVPQESTGYSPFELLYGRTVRGPMAVLKDLWTQQEQTQKDQDASRYVLELRNRIEETCKVAQDSLEKASVRYKKYFDAKAKNRTFQEGDKVLLLRPQKTNKLEMCWDGPFTVKERVGECDYRLEIRGKVKLYHANLLKRYVERKAGLAAIAVVDQEEEDQYTEVRTTNEAIPLIPLVQEENFQDVHLDPETPEMHEGIKEILRKNQRVLTDLPLRTHVATCSLDMESDRPIRTKQYPLPFEKREAIEKEVEGMLKMGVISPSNSPYSSPIVLVKKPDGKYRFCVDFRAVNKVLKFDAEPMPDVEYMFAKLAHAKYFSKIDLCKGYWQIPMDEKDKDKTAFQTPQGAFQWNVMPFGLKVAGAIFTRMMRTVLQPLKSSEIDNFIDDVLVATAEQERHLECLDTFFQRLDEVNLAARPSKCYLGFQTLEYLGHQLSQGKVRPMEDKLGKIAEAKPPTTKKQLRSFLGLAGYYRKFVPNFATVAKPLTDATKKHLPNTVSWNPELQSSFDQLKSMLTSQPVCILPDMQKKFVLRTDASDYGLGAVLLQEQGGDLKMVACGSRKLSGAEIGYSTIEKECYAIVWGVGKFSPYLHGKEFVIQSDHRPLEYLQGMKAKNRRLMRWALQLQPYSFVIQAIPGAENVGADFLSRTDRDI